MTYTEDELKAKVDEAVAAATAAIQAELVSLKDQAAQGETEAAIAKVTAEFEDQIAELQKALDEKVLEAASEKEAREKFENEITALAQADAEAKEKADRADARKDAVAEVASFPDEYVAANADRWAGMDDETFVAYLEDLKVVAAKAPTQKVPTGSALTAAADVTTTSKSILREVLELRSAGVDARQI